MKNILSFVQIILSILLTGLILIQAKGTGLGSSFGGNKSFFSTKRGVEKTIFWITIFAAVFFAISSLAQTVIFIK